MRKSLFAAIAIAVILIGTMATAQAVTSNVTVTAVVPTVFSLSLDTTSVPFGTITPEIPTVAAATVGATVKSNKLFNFGYTGADFTDGASLSMPINNLEHQVAGDAAVPWTTLATGSQSIAANVGRGSKVFNNSYRLTVPLTVDPATYSTTIVYEAVQAP